MAESATPASLLADIEARQDDLLRQLDELEKRIARVLADYAATQPAAQPLADAATLPIASPVVSPQPGEMAPAARAA